MNTHMASDSPSDFQSNAARTAGAVANAGERSFKGFSDTVQQLVKDVEAIAKEVGTLSADGFQSARETLSDKLSAAGTTLDESRAFCVEKSKEAADRTVHYVQERPLQAIGIAAAVGAVVAIYLTRSR
jgi:ElaB/YqjD/DUF883 family membrane-anchored ribosome-binding protein